LYLDPDPVFSNKGMEKGSGAGSWYEMIGYFAYYWGWTDKEIIQLPMRKRNKYWKVISWQMNKFGSKSFGG